MLQNASFLAIVAVDTDENEPLKLRVDLFIISITSSRRGPLAPAAARCLDRDGLPRQLQRALLLADLRLPAFHRLAPDPERPLCDLQPFERISATCKLIF